MKQSKTRVKFIKGEICLVEDFQEFGCIIVKLENKLIKNVLGEKMSYPLWEVYILDAIHKGFRGVIQEFSHLSLVGEPSLIKLENE